MSRICVVGLGYIGLPTAAMLASVGHEVIGCDVNAAAVASISRGEPHFHEKDLQMLLQAAVQTGRLRAQTTPAEADYFIIAVPTPFRDGKQPDMSYVDAATDSIAPFLKRGDCVILESTSPIGATERMVERLATARPDLKMPRFRAAEPADIHAAHCPERILPGQMLRELVHNDRIIGGITEACSDKALELYRSFVAGESFLTDSRTAELVKLTENSFRDVNIAFANELSLICDRMGINIWEAIRLANKHPRVNILQPGPGVGGHCIAVDPWFIVDAVPDLARLIRTAREVNDHKPHWVVERVQKLAAKFRAPVVACYGLAYKPDVDDLRESPSVEIAQLLAAEPGLRLLAVEPNVKALPAALRDLPNVELASAETALEAADIVVFLVGHKEFRRMPQSAFQQKMVVDAIGLAG